MFKPNTIELRKLMRQAVVSLALLTAVGGLTFASKGGGGEKKAATIPLKSEFVPIRTTNNFTLKSGPSYGGSFLLKQEKTPEYISFNTVVAYQKGNSTYILPYKLKVNTSALTAPGTGRNNLQMLDLRINMHK
jgi:hypothetical protein